MGTIREDYVSFETAKLLKEKGFKEITQGYITADKEIYMLNFQEGVYELGKNKYPYPTLQMAMKWLREVHSWTICISPYWPEGDMRNKLTWCYDIHSLIDNRSFRKSSYTDNCTEAVDAAIKYCLENLI